MTNEFERIWARIEGLERAVAALVDIQQRQLTSAASPLTNELRSQLAEIKTALAELPARSDSPPEIKVGQIKVVEPDGTLRMTISNQDRAPNGVINGKEFGGREGGNAAGIIFYNNNGDECGGLCYESKRMPDGSVQAFASLTFDRYQQDQVMCLQMIDEHGQVATGLSLWDRPTLPLDQWLPRALPDQRGVRRTAGGDGGGAGTGRRVCPARAQREATSLRSHRMYQLAKSSQLRTKRSLAG